MDKEIYKRLENLEKKIELLVGKIMMPPPSEPSSSKSSTNSPRPESSRKRHKQNESPNQESADDKDQEADEEESTGSIAPSNCKLKTQESIIGITFDEVSFAELPKNELKRMIDLESDFPRELAELAYNDLAKNVGVHSKVSDLNEATRQSIMHSLLVTLCSYVISKYPEIEPINRPRIVVNKSLTGWRHKNRKVNGIPDLSIVDARDQMFFYLMIEMKATDLDAGMRQGLVYLKRIRELNTKDEVGLVSKHCLL